MKKKRLLLSIMRISVVHLALILSLIGNVIASDGIAQEFLSKKISLKETDVKLESILHSLEQKGGFNFVYKTDLAASDKVISVDYTNQSIESVLSNVLRTFNLSYEVSNNYVIIKPSGTDKVKPATELADIVITGLVLDSQGIPLPGVSVRLKNSTTGTSTNNQGRYSINVPNSASVLVFSFIGFLEQEKLVGDQRIIDVTLSEQANTLTEVIVVGYGTQKKSDLTGAISQVKVSDINTTVTPNITEALQGRAAGVAISTNTSPGSRPSIRIRGSNSISANNEPLLVVDGFPLENGNLNDFNSDDVASVEILKDASATAIYGSRGANGVILLTTKRGVAGNNKVNFSGSYGVQQPSRLVKLVDGHQFVDYINAAYLNTTGRQVYFNPDPAKYVEPATYDADWQGALFRDSAPLQNYNLSFSGGNQKTKYLLSAGTFAQDGILKNSSFDRYTLRTNLDHSVNKWFTVGTHLQLNHSVKNYNNPNLIDVFRYGWPTMSVTNPDGSYYLAANDSKLSTYVEGRWNPVSDAGQVTDETASNRTFGDLYAELKFAKHFTLHSNFGADIYSGNEYYYAPSTATVAFSKKGIGKKNFQNEKQYITEHILTYDNTFQQKHHLTATAVYSYQTHTTDTLSMSGSGFPADITGYNDVSLASIIDVPRSVKFNNRLMSYTGRASYGFDNRYLVTLTGRVDGSTRFGANNKWGFFPSLGLGWNVSNEKFMSPLSDVITNLKVRGSYGYVGNQSIGNYKSLSLSSATYYIHNNNDLLLGLIEGLGNPDLKWEKTRTVDAGIDLNLFNRLDLNVDYYQKNTTDLLFQVPIPTTSGFRSVVKNIGEVQNKGFEFTLNLKAIDSKNFKWNIGGNLTKNNNEILSLYNNVNKVLLGDDQGVARYLVVGDPLNSVYTRISAGIIRTAEELAAAKAEQPKNTQLYLGSEKYVDVNGDGAISSADYQKIGTSDPKFYYGLNTSFTFKRFALDVYGQGASGIATLSTGYNLIGDYQIQGRNYIPSQYAYERMWSPTNPNGTFPRAGAKEVYFSDRSNGNREYFVIKNIRLGYDINPAILKRFLIDNVNVYVNAQNYVTFSNSKGYNPENGDVSSPYVKTLLFGLNLNF